MRNMQFPLPPAGPPDLNTKTQNPICGKSKARQRPKYAERGNITQFALTLGCTVENNSFRLYENVTAEEEQTTLLESIYTVEKDVYTSCRELTELRVTCNSHDI